MKIEITQVFTKTYFERNYQDWLKYKSKVKKWQPTAGVLFLLIGGFLMLFKGYFQFFFALWSLFTGIILLFNSWNEKRKWLNDRLQSKMYNQEVQFIIDENGIKTVSPFGTAHLKWSFFDSFIETPNGLIITPDKGTTLYLEKHLFGGQEEIDFVVNKIKENQRT